MDCEAWASAMSARVSRVLPQFSRPAHLWWEMTTGSPASRPMRMVSRTESRTPPSSSRMCVECMPPWAATRRAIAMTSSVGAARAGG